jgi:hypothetical protein
MKRTALSFAFVLTLSALGATWVALPVRAAPSTSQPAAITGAKPCQTYGYAHARCVIVPAHGRFYVYVTGLPIVLQGTGTPQTAGTEITTAQVQNPCPSTKAGSFRLFADGPIPPLTLVSPGTLYMYNPGTGTCTRISSITGPGVYEVVFPGGSAPAGAHAASKPKSHAKKPGHGSTKKGGK